MKYDIINLILGNERTRIMNSIKRTLLIALSLILLFTTLTACNEEPSDTVGTESKSIESSSEATPLTERNNYGDDFHMVIQRNSNNMTYYWVEESNNDALSEAVFDRQQKVFDYLGVDIIASESLGHDQYGAPFMNSVKNKDGAIDSLLSHAYMSLPAFIQEGYLLDFKDVDRINLEADHWGIDVMEGVATGDHLYLGYSNFRLAHTMAITYNKKMMDQYSDALEESIYDTVRGYRWTIDKMISIANLVYVDKTSDGKTVDDTFGITGRQWVPFVNFMQASNINLVSLNEKGSYVVSVYDEINKARTATLTDKLLELAKSDCSWFNYIPIPTEELNITCGRTLLSVEQIVELPKYLSFDVEFGIIPYPMFDEAQKDVGYRSLDWGGWICIPSYTDDLNMVADTLEVLSFYSEDVKVTFYEKLLGKQVAEAPEDREMLDMIWDSICSDMGLTYSHIDGSLDNNLYLLPRVTYANTSEQLASFVRSYETVANKKLKKFFEIISKQ